MENMTDEKSHIMKESIIALADCNSFYCSCEQVFKPSLKNKAVVVLSNNDGCVVARTDLAKKLGIKMGEPFFKIRDFCKKNSVAVFSSNYALYGDLSRRFMKTLSEFTSEMEIYSIDEAFLSLDGMDKSKLTNFAHSIRQRVGQNTGLPISIGIGSTKVLAKAANFLAKKNKIQSQGVLSFFDFENSDFFLKQIPVEEVWGIGRKSAEKLFSLNIKSACDLKYSNEKLIQKLLTITGRRIVEELRGQSCLSLHLSQSEKKQIISSRSFGKAVYALDEVKEALANHASSAAEKLRQQNSTTQTILVFLQTNPFKNTPQYYNSCTMNLISETSITNKLIRYSTQCLERIYKPDFEYKKVGIILMNIKDKSFSQLDFFQNYDSPKEDILMKTIDRVNQREGRGTLKFAACGVNRFWKMLSEMKSPNYTTRWSDLLKVD